MRVGLILAFLAAGTVLAGCARPPTETPAEVAARQSRSCQEAGFVEDTPDYQLCLLLQRTDERLEALERRLSRIDRDVGFASRYPFAGPYFGPRFWPYRAYYF